jgi:hypothetical protein
MNYKIYEYGTYENGKISQTCKKCTFIAGPLKLKRSFNENDGT